MKRPRWIERLRAFFGGYFWLPCPICRRNFGGHEKGLGRLMTSGCGGSATCPDCAEEGERRTMEAYEAARANPMACCGGAFFHSPMCAGERRMKVSIGIDLGRPGGDMTAICAYCGDCHPGCLTLIAEETVTGGEPHRAAERRVRAAAENHVCPKGSA